MATGCAPKVSADTLTQEWDIFKTSINNMSAQITSMLEKTAETTRSRLEMELAKEKLTLTVEKAKRVYSQAEALLHSDETVCCGCSKSQVKAYVVAGLETISSIGTTITGLAAATATESSGWVKTAVAVFAVTTFVLSKVKDGLFRAWATEEQNQKNLLKIEGDSDLITNAEATLRIMEHLLGTKDEVSERAHSSDDDHSSYSGEEKSKTKKKATHLEKDASVKDGSVRDVSKEKRASETKDGSLEEPPLKPIESPKEGKHRPSDVRDGTSLDTLKVPEIRRKASIASSESITWSSSEDEGEFKTPPTSPIKVSDIPMEKMASGSSPKRGSPLRGERYPPSSRVTELRSLEDRRPGTPEDYLKRAAGILSSQTTQGPGSPPRPRGVIIIDEKSGLRHGRAAPETIRFIPRFILIQPQDDYFPNVIGRGESFP